MSTSYFGTMICSAPIHVPQHHADGECIDVKVGNHQQVAGFAAPRVRLAPGFGLDDVREDVRVRQHRALRRAGRAAGVLQDGEILGRDGDPRQLVHAGVSSSSARHSVPSTAAAGASGRVLRDRRDDDVLDAGLARGSPSASGASLSSVISTRKPESLATFSEFARGVDRIDVDDDGAEAQDGERGDDVLRTVRQHDADAIALADAEPPSAVASRSRARLDLAERERRAEEGRRRRVGDVDRRRRRESRRAAAPGRSSCGRTQ